MNDYNHHKSWDEIWARYGKLSRQKIVIFLRFSSVIMNLFLTNRTNFVY